MTVTINGTTGVSGVDGSASTPSYQGTDTNTGLFYPAADTVAIGTGGSERLRVRSDGNISIGGTGSSAVSVYVQKDTSSAATSYGIYHSGQFQSGVTNGYAIQSGANVASGATLTNLAHFRATETTISGTVTNQIGFDAVSDLISATNNFAFRAQNTAAVTTGKTAYGFLSNINTATGGGTTYGFYAAGTADNYFAGKVTTAQGTTGYPAFNAYASASQTVTSAVPTKIAINTENFDTNSDFDTTTNRFTPTVEGYYQVNGTLMGTGATTFSALLVYIYKNGVNIRRTGIVAPFTVANNSQVSVSEVIYMNGSTDYIELYGQVNGTGTLQFVFSSSVATSSFSACLVRGA